MENETKIERGQIYYLKFDGSIGHEMAVGRPVLIVSNAIISEKSNTAVCLYMTHTPKAGQGVVKVIINNRASYILCNQFVTVDVSRLDTFMCKLEDSAMKRVNGALAYVLCLQGEISPSKKQETEIVENVDDRLDMRVELEMYQKLYQKSLSDLVEVSHKYNVLKLATKQGLNSVYGAKPDVEEIPFVPKETPVVVKEEPKLEVNTEALKAKMMGGEIAEPVDREEKIPQKLKKVYGGKNSDRGLTPEEIDELLIQAGMPPTSKKPMNAGTVGKAQLRPNAKPINVNTATKDDFISIGMGESVSRNIVSYRKKHGKFVGYGDLLNVKGVGKGVFTVFSPMWRL